MAVLKTLIAISALWSISIFAMTIPGEHVSELTKLDGTAVTPVRDKLAVYFWATWCPECKEKLTSEFPKITMPSDAELITINTDKDLDRVQHMLIKEKITLPVARDGKKTLTADLKVFSVPFWAVLKRSADGSWEIVDSESGGNLDKMKAALAKGG